MRPLAKPLIPQGASAINFLRMLGGANPELAVTGRRLLALMLDAKLLEKPIAIEGVLAPEPLQRLPP